MPLTITRNLAVWTAYSRSISGKFPDAGPLDDASLVNDAIKSMIDMFVDYERSQPVSMTLPDYAITMIRDLTKED
jgi:hypothetical protein